MNNDHSMEPIGNPAQWRAISYTGRYCLVLAGPGSGKTFVLTRHIQFLVRNCRVPPEDILVLTFSRAAARQMQARYQKLQQDTGEAPVVFGTFHSVFYHILKSMSGDELHLIDAGSRTHLLQTLCRQYVGNSFDERDMQKMEREISRRKHGTGETVHPLTDLPMPEPLPSPASALSHSSSSAESAGGPDYAAAYGYYETYLSDNHLIDFDDMILRCREELKTHPDILRRWQERFWYILIDEFQDISPAQYEIIRMLHRPGNGLFCVGDDDQAIYGFRGADPEMLRRFRSDYPKVATISLKINYRSGKKIIAAAQKVICENSHRIPKRQSANSSQEAQVTIHSYVGEQEEYAQICRLLQTMDSNALARTAIICRTHAGKAGLIYVMKQYGIGYAGQKAGTSPSKKTEILRDLQAYLRMAIGLRELGTIRRSDYYQVMNKPVRYLNRSSADREEMTPADFLRQVLPGTHLYLTYSDLFRDLSVIGKLKPPLATQYLLTSVGYQDYALRHAGTVYAEEIRQFLDSLRERSRCARTLREWVGMLSDAQTGNIPSSASLAAPALQQTPQDSALQQRIHSGIASPAGIVAEPAGGYGSSPSLSEVTSRQGVHLMTMHASKGLEFDTVILPDLNEGILPSRKSDTPEGIEEERRLFYVAMTRARERLYLLYIRGSAINPRRPSRFLSALGVRAWIDEP